mmetsp:Transcript_110564/g.202474  ORF Transcript_110564/g.202474 Transcript_110564/m.202474 type:complete len:711 (+) Transcript_110564:3-2135(+)
MLNHTLFATQQNLTHEQNLRITAEQNLTREHSLRSAAEENASSLASQLAALRQANAEAEMKSKAELQKLTDELNLVRKEVPQLTEQLNLARQEVTNEKAKEATEEKKYNSTLRVARLETKMRQQMKQQLTQKNRELAEMSQSLALMNGTMAKKNGDLNATRAKLSADEARIESAIIEVVHLNRALQDTTDAAEKQEETAKKNEQKDMEELAEAQHHVGQLTDAIARVTKSSAKEKDTLESKLLSANNEMESDRKEVAYVRQQLIALKDDNLKLNAKVKSLSKSLDTEKAAAAKDAFEMKSKLAKSTAEISKKGEDLKAALKSAKEEGAKLTRTESQLGLAKSQVLQTDKQLKEAVQNAKTLGLKLRKTEAAAQVKEQRLKVEEDLSKKLHMAEATKAVDEKKLKTMSDDANELKRKLDTSEASAKSTAQKLKATEEQAKKLDTELRNALASLKAKDQEVKAKQAEIQAKSDETSKLGVNLHSLKAKKEQELKSAQLNSEQLKAKLAKLDADKRHEDQELKEVSKEATQFQVALHNAEVKLNGANSEIRMLETDKEQLAKLRSSLRGVSEVAAKQTQAFRKFEYIDEQLRAELNSVAAATPAPAEAGANMGMVEVKAVKFPAALHEKVAAETDAQPAAASTTVIPEDKTVQPEPAQESVDAKSPKASLLSSKADENAEVLFDYLKEEMADAPDSSENDEDMPVQGDAEFAP